MTGAGGEREQRTDLFMEKRVEAKRYFKAVIHGIIREIEEVEAWSHDVKTEGKIRRRGEVLGQLNDKLETVRDIEEFMLGLLGESQPPQEETQKTELY